MQEISQDLESTELQVPRPVQLPGTADWPAHSLGEAETDFNFRLPVCYSSATLRATAASLDLRTLPLPVRVIRRVGGGLLSQHLLRDLKLTYHRQLRV